MLSDPELSGDVTHLLVRDPWQSDVPALLANLRKKSDNDWTLVNALKYHNIPGLPIQQEISKAIGSISFTYPRAQHLNRLEQQAAAARNEMRPQDAQVLGILQSIKELKKTAIKVDDSLLLERQFWGNSSTEFGCENCIGVGGKVLLLSTFLENMSESRIQYAVEGKQLRIFTSSQARRRLLAWWEAKPADFNAQFSQDKAPQSPTNKIWWGWGF